NYFTVVANADDHRDIDKYLDSGKAQVAVWIPNDFSKNIKTGKNAELQVIVDGSDSNTATIALGYITAISELYSQRIKGGRITPLIDPRVRVWYNPELKSRNYIIPGLIAVIMAVIAALLTSLTIAREWERGTMEQLISTPVKTPELIIGKLLPYFFIGFVDVALSVIMAVFVFEVPLQGNLLLLAVLSSIFLFGGLSLGILISIAAKSQLVASQISMVVTFLPAFLLSGFMYAIANMPKPLQMITHIIPARYFVSILKGIFLKGNTFKFLIFETILLTFFGLMVFALANKKFKKRII
ncbi:MAG: ABC transporter permease, partial [Nitrospirota bacterium]